MEGLIEEHVIADAIELEIKKFGEKLSKIKVKRWEAVFCYFVFFLMGVCHFLPITFFAAANNFWLYKFRNTSLPDDSSPENRTFLQKNFASSIMISSSIPTFLFGVLNVGIGHKFRISHKLYLSLFVSTLVYLFFTVSVEINTDNSQTLFFVLLLLANAVISALNTINITSTMALFSRFPHIYMESCLTGEGAAGIVGDLLNIFSIFIFNGDLQKSTFLYFFAGTFVLALTTVSVFVIMKMKFFNEFMDLVPEQTDKKIPSRKDLFRIVGKIKFNMILACVVLTSFAVCHTPVTALVVSEQTGSGWAKNYFSPVMTFLLSDVTMFLGRVFSPILPSKLPDYIYLTISVVQCAVLIPMVWLCNAQPRRHLPVVFPHDYQYGILLGTLMFNSGFLLNLAILKIPERVEKQEADVTYTLFGLTINTMQTVSSPLGMLVVNML